MDQLKTLLELRRRLHRFPDLSESEGRTRQLIIDFFESYHQPDFLRKVGKTGLLATYDFGPGGPHVMLRCELDALPIAETLDIDHCSEVPGVSHKCGHDGHMVMVAGVIFNIRRMSLDSGRVSLLFQPAEETGRGALAVLEDPEFRKLKVDYIFALHNIPGSPMHRVIVNSLCFSTAVESCAIRFWGKEGHAAYPESGSNPAQAMAKLIRIFQEIQNADIKKKNYRLLTPVGIRMGDPAYGISPGFGELHYTIRARSNAQLLDLKDLLMEQLKKVCREYELKYEIDWLEYFPAVENHAAANAFLIQAVRDMGLEMEIREDPFAFGEDFGWFASNYNSAMFGLGAGMDTPALHHNDYDFPDELLETGIRIFSGILKQIFGPPA